MGELEDIRSDVGNIVRPQWATRDGTSVPETKDVELGNSAVKFIGAVLYADLVQSTELVRAWSDFFAAEVFKSFLKAACLVIRRNGGAITAFDGDRVMAVYLGESKCTQATTTALEINKVVREVVNPVLKEVYPKSPYEVRFTVGVDTGPLFVARAGVRGSNDLVWVGRAANYAAKLCAVRAEGVVEWITSDVYKAISNNPNLTRTSAGQPVWKRYKWSEHDDTEIYGANAWSWT